MDCVGVVGAWDRGFGVIPFEALGSSVQDWGSGDLGHRPWEGEQMGFRRRRGGRGGKRGTPEHGLILPFSGRAGVVPRTYNENNKFWGYIGGFALDTIALTLDPWSVTNHIYTISLAVTTSGAYTHVYK